MRRLTLLAVVAVLPLGFAPAPKPKPLPAKTRADLKALQGTWELLSINGHRMKPGEDSAKVAGIRLTLTFGFTDGDIVLDPSKFPRWIDIRHGDDLPARGIYRLKGDRWTVCFGANCKRPTAFVADKDILLLVLKRKKPLPLNPSFAPQVSSRPSLAPAHPSPSPAR